MYRSATYDFLLTFHSNNGRISCTVSEIKGDFSRKSQNFPTPVYFAPLLTRFPLELGIHEFKNLKKPFRHVQYQRVNDRETDRERTTAKTALGRASGG